MNYFVILATILFSFLGVIWTRNGLFNLFLKFAFIGMSLYGIFLELLSLGYILKIDG